MNQVFEISHLKVVEEVQPHASLCMSVMFVVHFEVIKDRVVGVGLQVVEVDQVAGVGL